MAHATESFTGVGAQQEYTFLTLTFLSDQHLSMTVDDVATDFVISADQTTITVDAGTPIAGGEVIEVIRTTPATKAGRIVVFQDESGLRRADLDTATLQLLYVAQEAIDVKAVAAALSQAGGHWDATSLRIKNLADGVDPADAVTQNQLSEAVIAAGNLPVVTTGENDYGLFVVTGAWATRTPAQIRTHLGLGSAALLDAGTGALDLVQLDVTTAYMPAVDGRNIDLSNHSLAADVATRALAVSATFQAGTYSVPADATADWRTDAANDIDWGTAGNEINSSGEVTLDGVADSITLAAGTWLMQFDGAARNEALTGFDDISIAMADVDGSLVLWDDLLDININGSGTSALYPPQMLSGHHLFDLASDTTFYLRIAGTDGGSDIDMLYHRVTFTKLTD